MQEVRDRDGGTDGVWPEGRVATPAGRVPEEADDPASAHAEDHALIRRAQAGEDTAFADLVRRHEARAWRVAKSLVGSAEDASDLVQEAFLRAFRNLAGFDFEHGFSTWLYRIVTNLSIDHLRRRRSAISTARAGEDEADIDLPDAGGEGPSDRIESAELSEEVRACLSSLAPHFQAVLVLREIEGLPCKQIARIVGATHVTVRWRLHRGRKLFQEEWERRARLAAGGGGRGLLSPSASNAGRSPDVEDPAEDPEVDLR